MLYSLSGGRGKPESSSFLLLVCEVWICFIQEFAVQIVGKRDIRVTIEEFLLCLLFKERCCLLWLAGVCAELWDIWGERNNRVFRSLEDPCEIWSLVRFHVLVWASVFEAFCNYSLGNILLIWKPFFRRVAFVGLYIYISLCPYIISFFLNEVVDAIKNQ